MYHYVRPFDKELPYFKNLDVEDFSQQLDYFEKEFGFVSKQEFLDSFKTGITPKGVVLTFDDGLKCHYNFVYKELKKRNLWGIFYISTDNYQTNKLLDVHRVHLLLGRCSSETVYKELMKITTDDILKDQFVSDFQLLTYSLQDNDEYTKSVKQILNYYIDYDFREKVIDELILKLIPEELNRADSFYMTVAEINELHANGMIVGSHTVSHSVMSKLTVNQQKKEIKESFSFLESVVESLPVKTFCYPYGGFHTFTEDTIQLLNKEECLFSFNVEHRDINDYYLTNNFQALPRYDCNVFPYGKCR